MLNSYAAAPAYIYLDFNGDVGQNISEFDLDNTPGTFTSFEQQKIVEHWRGVSAIYSMFNVGVTTNLADATSKPTAWLAITNDMNTRGGVNAIDSFPDTEPSGTAGSDFWAYGYAHEIAHGFGDWHLASYDNLGMKTAEYGPGESADPLHGGIMGGGSGPIQKWAIGHTSFDLVTGLPDVSSIQDDMARIAADLDARDGAGDGYRPDDYTGTSIATATPLTVVNSTTQSKIGIIERLTDQDWFSFASTGGTYSVLVGHDSPSGVDVKISVYNSSGTLIASEDGDPRAVPYMMVNDQHVTLNLAAGNYYVKVESHGNYDDQGQYVVRVDTIPDGWLSDDVGLTGVPGFANFDASTGTYTLAGSGADIWGSQDGFQYLYQQLSGDGSITVRVTGMEDTADWAKAGIMFRESLADNAKEAYLVNTPHNGLQWSARTTVGGNTSAYTPNTGTSFTPTWLRIVRSGNTFTAFKAGADGVFTQFGSPLTVSMSSKVYVGLVSSAVDNTLLNKATFTNVSLPGPWTAQNMGTVGVSGSASYNAVADTYTLSGSGRDFGGVPSQTGGDAALINWQKLTGDGSITGRIASMNASNANATSGILMRETLNTDSKYFAVWAYGNNGLWRNRRTTTGGDSGGSVSVFGGTNPMPIWARITRSGNSFSSWYSTNGVNWTQLGSAQTITMGAEIYIGLMAASGDTTTVNTSTFTNVRYTGQPDVQPLPNSLSAPTGVTLSNVTSSGVNIAWNDQFAVPGDFNGDRIVDAGDYLVWRNSNGPPANYTTWRSNFGKVGLSATGYSVERSSDGITFTEIGVTAINVVTFADTGLGDAQRYFYRVRAKDASGVSVPSSAVNTVTRAGAVTNLNIFSASPTKLVLEWKDASSESSYKVQRSADGVNGWTTISTPAKNTSIYVNSSGLTANTPYYYRVITVDSSGDSATSAVASAYSRVNSTPANVAFSNRTATSMTLSWNALSGMTRYAVYRALNESDNEWELLNSNIATTTYTDSTVSPLTEYHYRLVGYNANGAASLKAEIFGASAGTTPVPSPWVSQDIGAVGGVGAAGITGSTFKIMGGGADVWGTNDEFHYVSQPLSGDGSITVRVASMENPAASYYSRAGIMIRETTAVGSKYASMMLHPTGGGVRLQSRASTNGNTSEINGAIVNAPYYLRLTRSGNTFTGEISTNGSSWTTVGSVNVTMGADVLVGMAVTDRNDSYLHWGTFDNVSITTTGSAVGAGDFLASSPPSTFANPSAFALAADLNAARGNGGALPSRSSSLNGDHRRTLDDLFASYDAGQHQWQPHGDLVDAFACKVQDGTAKAESPQHIALPDDVGSFLSVIASKVKRPLRRV